MPITGMKHKTKEQGHPTLLNNLGDFSQGGSLPANSGQVFNEYLLPHESLCARQVHDGFANAKNTLP